MKLREESRSQWRCGDYRKRKRFGKGKDGVSLRHAELKVPNGRLAEMSA